MARIVLSFDRDRGCLAVICGCAYSGKTDELITTLGVFDAVQEKALACVPFGERTGGQRRLQLGLGSHDGRSYPASLIERPRDLLSMISQDHRGIVIDDAHLLNVSLSETCRNLAQSGLVVLVAGRDSDNLGRPIRVMGELLALADQVDKKSAVCRTCGLNASFTAQVDQSNEEPRCRKCFLAERVRIY